MIENTIGIYSLPLGLGMNMLLNDKHYVVPMAMEELLLWRPKALGRNLLDKMAG